MRVFGGLAQAGLQLLRHPHGDSRFVSHSVLPIWSASNVNPNSDVCTAQHDGQFVTKTGTNELDSARSGRVTTKQTRPGRVSHYSRHRKELFNHINDPIRHPAGSFSPLPVGMQGGGQGLPPSSEPVSTLFPSVWVISIQNSSFPPEVWSLASRVWTFDSRVNASDSRVKGIYSRVNGSHSRGKRPNS